MTAHQRDPEDWGPWRTETRELMAATDIALATLRTDMQGADTALHERVDEARAEAATADTATNARVDETRMELSTLANELILTNQRVTDHGTVIDGLIDANVILSQRITDLDMRTASNDQAHDTQLAALRFDLDALTERVEIQRLTIETMQIVDQTHGDLLTNHEERIVALEQPDEPDTWQDRPDLLPDKGQTVFGVFSSDGETLDDVAVVRPVGLTTRYWKRLTSPAAFIERNRDRGIITRLELELTHAFVEAGEPVDGLWARIAVGEYDDILRDVLAGVGPLASICHEADLAPSEQGGYEGVKAGTLQDYAAMFRHVVTLGREVTPATRWVFNMSSRRDRWGDDLTDEGSTGMYPGHKYVDFVGWDGFDWFNVPWHEPKSKDRTPFGQMMELFGRWDWYRKYFGSYGEPGWKPLLIGETACSEADPPHQPADEWMDDMRAWLHDHPEVTHVIWFSGNPVRHITKGAKRTGLERLGGDTQLV